jgi:hypothetical protein
VRASSRAKRAACGTEGEGFEPSLDPKARRFSRPRSTVMDKQYPGSARHTARHKSGKVDRCLLAFGGDASRERFGPQLSEWEVSVMAKDKESPDPQWADRLEPDQQREGVEEEEEDPTPPEQGPPEP